MMIGHRVALATLPCPTVEVCLGDGGPKLLLCFQGAVNAGIYSSRLLQGLLMH
jgi:hypothetical protein